MHCRPASSTDHFELSTMIGRRATSGSVAITFRNVRIASSPSSRSASMFTSSRFAPPRTCSSATSTAAPKSPASTRRRNRAEPVTFVRSPIITKPVSGPSSKVSSPLNLGRSLFGASVRGARPCTASAIARVCSGVEPQHEPATLTNPSCANSRRSDEVTSGVSS